MSDEVAPDEAAAETDAELDHEMARYVGHFLESADLMQNSALLTISGVVPPNREKDKDGKGKPIDKPIIAFKGTTKRFILGKTNERILKAIHGSRASGWIGKQIRVGVRYLKEAFGEKNVPTLRIMVPAGTVLPMNCRKFYGADSPFPA